MNQACWESCRKPKKDDFFILTSLPLIIGLLILPSIDFPVKCYETFCKRVIHVDETAIILSLVILTGFLIFSTIISPRMRQK